MSAGKFNHSNSSVHWSLLNRNVSTFTKLNHFIVTPWQIIYLLVKFIAQLEVIEYLLKKKLCYNWILHYCKSDLPKVNVQLCLLTAI